MATAFVLGNGTSRKTIDLDQLKSYGKIYGCNALYREFAPDVLVATDPPMAQAIIESGYAKLHTFYTRAKTATNGALTLPPEYQGYSSGPNALALAALNGHDKIYMLGFDMGPSELGAFNNLYADTEFYKTSAHPPTFTGNWVRQIAQITKDFLNIQFIRVAGSTTATIKELQNLPNMNHKDLDSFLECINTQRNL